MGIVRGAVVPHAPVLIDGVRPSGDDLSAVRDAAGRIDMSGLDVVVVVSPHGPEGVYRENRAELGSMGLGVPELRAPHDAEFVATLAELWGRPLLDGVLDHGASVPLHLLDLLPRVVCVSLGGKRPVSAAADLESALGEIDLVRRIGLVASANLSAGLNERAPLTLLQGARALEERTLSEARVDAHAFTHRAPDLAIVGGSCAGGPLTLFGRVFARRPLEILEYRSPFGVGYLVATAAA